MMILPYGAPALLSVSDGSFRGSLPSGEIEPAVTLACAPSDDAGPDPVPFGLDTGASAPDRDEKRRLFNCDGVALSWLARCA
jgi:hypothetical protein